MNIDRWKFINERIEKIRARKIFHVEELSLMLKWCEELLMATRPQAKPEPKNRILVIPALSKADKHRLRKFVVKRGDCWEWIGSCNKDGYGQFRIGGKLYRVHRVIWALKYGKIPRGLLVLHSCDNPRCCRPKHLFLGTQIQNVQDCILKGRFKTAADKNRLKLECPRGHKYDIENTYLQVKLNGSVHRSCRKCRAIHLAKYKRNINGK